jgi:hypothetical protein
MKFLALILSVLVALTLFAANPVRAADSWDIEEFDSCIDMDTEDQERIFGDDEEALDEHYRYCCHKSGGEYVKYGANGYCVAPPASAGFALSLGILKDWVNSGRLEQVCRDVDGLFDKGLSGKSHLCKKENCDLRGGECQIVCAKDQQCVFLTPDRLTGRVTLFGILQNGDNVNHSREEASPSESNKAKADEPTPCGPDGCLY